MLRRVPSLDQRVASARGGFSPRVTGAHGTHSPAPPHSVHPPRLMSATPLSSVPRVPSLPAQARGGADGAGGSSEDRPSSPTMDNYAKTSVAAPATLLQTTIPHPSVAPRASDDARRSSPDKFGKAPEQHGSVSRREDKASIYTKRLQDGLNGIPGIMSKYDREGKELLPFDHQRCCVRKFSRAEWGLISHDAGLGKTATTVQLFCALWLLNYEKNKEAGMTTKMVVTAPLATLDQWQHTLMDWLFMPNLCIFRTTKSKEITDELLDRVTVLVTTRHCLSKAYMSCHTLVKEHHKNNRNQWVSGYVRAPGTALHPLFKHSADSKPRFTMMAVDEVHFLRNADTGWTVAHAALAQNCATRFGLSATPVFNNPKDMVGICRAINSAPMFQNWRNWSVNDDPKKICKPTVMEFNKNIDRVDDRVLNLPPIHQETVSFDAGFDTEESTEYNEILASAQALRTRVDRQGKASLDDLRRLMQMLGKLQQYLVSPLLGRLGAAYFKEHKECYVKAASQPSGAMKALFAQITKMQENGLHRVMIACQRVEPMKIAKVYAQVFDWPIGEMFRYDGDMPLAERTRQKQAFLKCDKGVLFLSIDAGGTGLHLVPGCNAAIFWGTRPFSPAQVWQTLKRIHRISQTDAVYISHIICEGSVDYAINVVHGDKSRLAKAILDDDWSNMGEDGCSWRASGRIMDLCWAVNTNGKFDKAITTKPEKKSDHKVSGKRSAAAAAATSAQPVALKKARVWKEADPVASAMAFGVAVSAKPPPPSAPVKNAAERARSATLQRDEVPSPSFFKRATIRLQ